MKSCMTCSLWSRCSDPHKGSSHSCKKHEAFKKTSKIIQASADDVAEFATPDLLPLRPNLLGVPNEGKLESLVKDLLASNDPIPPDLRIPDKDIPLAKNFVDWITNAKFGKSSTKPFAKQAMLIVRLLSEFCPRCSDTEWFFKIPVKASMDQLQERVMLLEHDKCPKCKKHKTELIADYDLENPYQLIAVVGQRSGKTAQLVMLETYRLSQMLKLNNPAAAYSVRDNQFLAATYVATTFAQAVENVWLSYIADITNLPWYKNYHAMLDSVGERYGSELYFLRAESVQYNHKLLSIMPSGPNKRTLRGKCLVGDTLINTNEGFVYFGGMNIPKGFTRVFDMTIDSPKGVKNVSHVYSDISETKCIVTKNGYSIEGTPEHPVLVFRDNLKFVWTRLDKLQLGDWIVSTTKKNSPMFGSNKLTLNAARILGYYVANGHNASFSSGQAETIKRFKEAVFKETGKKVVTKQDGNKTPNHRPLWKGYNGNGTFYSEWLAKKGFTAKSSKAKVIPNNVLSAPREIFHEFLEAYFECDSGINGGAYEGRPNNSPPEIEISSASKKLAKQLHILLLHVYGLVGRMTKIVRYSEHKEQYVPYWIISYSGYDAYQFLQTFKRAKVQKYADRFHFVEKGFGSDRRKIPYVRSAISDAIEKARLYNGEKPLRRLRWLDGSEKLNTIKPKVFAGRVLEAEYGQLAASAEYLVYNDDWESIIPKLDNLDKKLAKRIRKFLSLSPHLEQIVSISDHKKKKVYDVTVPEGHCFTANGLASHNTRFSASYDELGWAGSGLDNIKMNGAEIVDALERSMTTLAGEHSRLIRLGRWLPKPVTCYISSPSEMNDPIMTKYRESRHDSNVLRIKLPTWKFNPKMSRYHTPIIVSAYKNNPVNAERDYGANPPMSSNAWVARAENVVNVFSGKLNGLRLAPVYFKSKGRKRLTSARLGIVGINADKPLILALDSGWKDNSFAFALASIANESMTIEGVAEIIPSIERPISFTSVYKNVILELVDKLNIKLVVTDRWQHIKLIQDLEEETGIESEQIRLTYSDFSAFREDMYHNKMRLPKLDLPAKKAAESVPDYRVAFADFPVAHLLNQMLTVQDYPGEKVDKGHGYTDDLLRAVVAAYAALQIQEIRMLLKATPASTGGVISSSVGKASNGGTGISGVIRRA